MSKSKRVKAATSSGDSPLAPLASAWRKKIRLAQEFKHQQFDLAAREAMKFFNSDHSFLWDQTDPRSLLYNARIDSIEAPDFQMTYNIVAELVQLFVPTLYHKNPHRQVNPRLPLDVPKEMFVDPLVANQMQRLAKQMEQSQQMQQQQMPPGPDGQPQQVPPDPRFQQMMQALQQQQQQQEEQFNDFNAKQLTRYAKDKTRAALLEKYLNYTPNELDLKTNFRLAAEEALIKGMSFLSTELYKPEGGDFVMVGSFHESADNVVYDPDVQNRTHATWMARRCIHPVWQVERKFGRKPGSLKANLESLAKAGEGEADPWAYKLSKLKGQTNDLLVYWEIYSKMGMGGRLKGMNSEVGEILDEMGDYCYLAVADGIEGILNLPEDAVSTLDTDELQAYTQWPTPFWADDEWPLTIVHFHDVPDQIYPMSHVTPAIGEIKFIDFCMSFLANKVRTVCDDLMGVIKAAEDDIRAALTSPSINGYKTIGIEAQFGTKINEMISFIQRPPFHGDIWKMLAEVAQSVAKRLGLTELAYGQSDRQYRSAAEANAKQNNYSVRPDDMANKMEDASSLIARKEAIACRWHLKPEDIAPVLGDEAAWLWEQLVISGDLSEVMREFEYRIEESSSKKPNKDRDMANMQQSMQVILPLLEKHAFSTGNFDALNHFLKKWWDTMDMPADAIPVLQAPPPHADPKAQEAQMKMQLAQQQGQLQQQKAQADLQVSQQELQLKAAEAQMAQQQSMAEAQLEQQRLTAEIQGEQQKGAIEMQIEQMRMQLDQMTAALQLRQDAQKHAQEMAFHREDHTMEMTLAKQKARVANQATLKKAAQKPQPRKAA